MTKLRLLEYWFTTLHAREAAEQGIVT